MSIFSALPLCRNIYLHSSKHVRDPDPVPTPWDYLSPTEMPTAEIKQSSES